MRAPLTGTEDRRSGRGCRVLPNDERERRPVSGRNATECGRVMGYLEKSPTSNEHPASGYHMSITEFRSPAHGHGSAGAPLTHLLDHESPPGPRRLPESSRPVAGGSSCTSRERPSRLPAGASRARAAVRRLGAGLLLVVAGLLALPHQAEAQTAGICGRTAQVRAAILLKIPSVSDCALVTGAHLATIRELDLTSKEIDGVHIGDFDGLTSLTHLYLGDNSLTTLPDTDVFDDLTQLEALTLNNNSLSTLENGVFENLTKLTSLSLRGNPGAPFRPTAVALPEAATVSSAGGTVRLDGRDSGGGPWGTNVTYSWSQTSGPTSGVTFDDANTAEAVVTIPALPVDTELAFTLTVTGRGAGGLAPDINGIAPGTDAVTVTVPEGICGRTRQVRAAIVGSISGITDCGAVSDTDLAAITGLLDLTNKGITALAAGDFDGLALTRLWIGKNSLETLPAGVFDELTALEALNLGANNLETLPAGVFDELTALTQLYLHEGILETLPAGVFDELTALTELYLHSNPGAPFSATAVALPDDGEVASGGGTVRLDGSGSGGPWGTNVTYGWSQTSGPTSGVTFDDAASAKPVVTIPALTAGTELTFTLTVTGRATDASRGTAPGTNAATVTASDNVAPSFTSPGTFSAAENQTGVGTVAATDGDSGDDVTGYAIQGGADASKFSIVASTGVLTFASAPNFEDAADDDGNNEYVVVVRATSGTGARVKTADQTITVTVTDVGGEAPDVPGAPTVTGSTTSVTVSWTAPSNTGPPITSYDLQYRAGDSGGFTPGPQDEPGPSATINGLTEGTGYEVQVRATNDEGDSDWSESGSGTTTIAMCLAPDLTGRTQIWTGTVTVAGNVFNGVLVSYGFGHNFGALDKRNVPFDTSPTSVDLARVSVTGQLAFSLNNALAAADSEGLVLHVCADASFAFADAGLISATHTYTWANSGLDWSAVTTRVLYLSGPTVPGAPTGLTATANGTTTIDLTWTAPSDGGSVITGYKIEVSSDGGASWANLEGGNTGTSSTTYSHTGLDAGDTRHYRVSAINSVGTGAASSTASATTTTLSSDVTLSALTVNDGTTDHTIDLATTPYTLNVGNAVTTVTLTATPTHTGASVSAVTLGGTAIADTDFTDGITVPSLVEGANVIVVTVTAEDGRTTEPYMVTVTRAGTTTTTAPAIVTGGVQVTSTPMATADTYGLGETIQITVTFDNAVTVNTSDGTPRIQFVLNGTGSAELRWAEYSSGSGGTALVFTYTVQSGDKDDDGIWLRENKLEIEGGTISAAADNTVAATLTYARPGTQSVHKVNGSLTTTDATLSALALSGVTLDPNFVSSTETYTATVGNSVMQTTVTATPTHPGATVAVKDGDDNALANPVTLAVGDNVIKAVVTAPDATTMKTYMVTVTRGATAMPAIVTDGVQVTSTPMATVDTYGRGETIEITVTFDNAVTVGTSGGTPRIAFFLDGVLIRWAEYSSGSGGTDLVFTYTVQSGDLDVDGIRLEGNFLKPQGGTIRSAADNTVAATLTYADLGLKSGHKVDGTIVPGSTVPGAPTSLTARASGTTTINLSWTEPSNNGGSPITGYKIEVSSNGGANWNDRVANTGNTNTTYAHIGLSAGTTRHYRVSAINANGTGAASNIDNATTGTTTTTVPGAPTGLTATASGTNRIDLSWNAPADGGGASISGYKIEVSSNGGANWNDRVANTGNTNTTYAHIGLSAGTTRHYRVSAINANGTGAASNIDNATTGTTTTTVPGAPTGLTATASGTNRIDLSWNAPADGGGASISGYKIEVSSNGGTSWTDRVANTGNTNTTYAHIGLSAGTTRHYRVSAINANGTGAASNIDNATTGTTTTTVPGAPTGLTATASGTNRIDLSWNAPADDGGASISGYKIEVSSNGGTSWTDRVADTGNANRSYSYTGLSAGDTRHYRVSAINSVGPGPASNTANATTEEDDEPGLAMVTVHALAPSVSVGGTARFELRRSGGDLDWLKVSYRHEESDGNYVESWGYFKPGVTEKKADYTVGSSGTVTARVTGPSDPLCTGNNDSSSCTDNYEIGNPASASMQVTASASSSDDALEDALTLVDDLTPDVAAAVLLGEQRLGEAELAALDRLGNGNGRYDLGDLLSWIDRCRRGEAHCGRTSADSGPAAAALLGGAAAGGRSTPRRPGRRDSGRRGRKPIRTARHRGRFAGYALATLLAATLTLSCTEGSVAPPAYVPDPGFLTVEWSGPATHRDVGVLLEFEGPAIDAVRAPGRELYESSAPGPRRIVVAGVLRPGPLVQFRVPDRGQFALYRVRVLEVTGEGYGLRDPTEYRAVVIMN